MKNMEFLERIRLLELKLSIVDNNFDLKDRLENIDCHIHLALGTKQKHSLLSENNASDDISLQIEKLVFKLEGKSLNAENRISLYEEIVVLLDIKPRVPDIFHFNEISHQILNIFDSYSDKSSQSIINPESIHNGTEEIDFTTRALAPVQIHIESIIQHEHTHRINSRKLTFVSSPKRIHDNKIYPENEYDSQPNIFTPLLSRPLNKLVLNENLNSQQDEKSNTSISQTTIQEHVVFDEILSYSVNNNNKPALLNLKTFVNPEIIALSSTVKVKRISQVFRYFNFLRALLTSIYSIYQGSQSLNNSLYVKGGASPLVIISIFVVCIKIVFAFILAFPTLKCWKTKDNDPFSKWLSVWSLLADYELITDIFPTIVFT